MAASREMKQSACTQALDATPVIRIPKLLTQVFEHVPETRGREGDILLLEEDHMPTPDLLETMKRLLGIKNSGDCQGCWGAYSKFGCERQEQETDVHKASSR
jgi:hypothetical protein